ncbi:cysteine proteinase [Panus rudis PR-1116 ss-1]|nr:cysteine proteinase [Panus rudis PR-1116 ss-1]
MIEDSIVERPLIAPLAPMAVLRAEYENGNPNFLKQIDWLVERGYQGIRRTRGDGDCFYRSLAFAYVERIMNAPEPELSVMRAISMLETTPAKLSSVGFQELVFEDFYDMFRSLIMRIIQPEPGVSKLNARGLFDAFNDPETSNSIVMYLRLLTSAQIRLDPENYAPFLFHPELGEPMETVAFCENFVEAVGKEADHPQITALSRALNVSISVAYLDGHDRNSSDPVNFVPFDTGDDSEEPIRLLYRPGHYDILDSRSEEPLT